MAAKGTQGRTLKPGRSRRRALAAAAILGWAAASILFPVPLSAGDSGTPRPAAPGAELPAIETEDWFSMSLHNQRVGWVSRTVERVSGETAPLIRVTELSEAHYINRGVLEGVSIQERLEFDAASPYSLRSARYRAKHERFENAATLTRSGGTYLHRAEQDGLVRSQSLPLLSYSLEEHLAISLWMRRSPAAGDSIRFGALDILGGSKTSEIATISREVAPEESGLQEKIFEVVGRSGELVERFFYDQNGRQRAAFFTNGLELRASSEAEARAEVPADPPSMLPTISIDKPLGPPNFIRRLVLRVKALPGSLPSSARQLVVVEGDSILLKLGAPYGAYEIATHAAQKDALEETIDYPIRHPEVQALAERAIRGARTPEGKLKNAVLFLRRFVKRDSLPAISVRRVMKERRGNSAAFSLLLAALLRAEGIPCREVDGFVYQGDQKQEFAGHRWNEVAINGRWQPVDPSLGEVEIDATHVKLWEKGKSDAARRLLFRETPIFSVVEIERITDNGGIVLAGLMLTGALLVIYALATVKKRRRLGRRYAGDEEERELES